MPHKTLQDLDNAALSKLMDIHCGLSPENLSGDGELSRRETDARYRELITELKEFQATHGLSDAEVDECKVYDEYERRGSPGL